MLRGGKGCLDGDLRERERESQSMRKVQKDEWRYGDGKLKIRNIEEKNKLKRYVIGLNENSTVKEHI